MDDLTVLEGHIDEEQTKINALRREIRSLDQESAQGQNQIKNLKEQLRHAEDKVRNTEAMLPFAFRSDQDQIVTRPYRQGEGFGFPGGPVPKPKPQLTTGQGQNQLNDFTGQLQHAKDKEIADKIVTRPDRHGENLPAFPGGHDLPPLTTGDVIKFQQMLHDGCHNTMFWGHCNKQEACKFSHDVPRLKLSRNNICTFDLMGNCRWGDKCKFEHDPEFKKSFWQGQGHTIE